MARTPTKKRRPRRRTLLITLGPTGGTVRRRADITWTVGRTFTVQDLASHRDCGRWVLEPGWTLTIEAEDENGEAK